MQIISGKYKGTKIDYPPNIRPSTAKHKKTVFDILRFNIVDANVLDLYSGSGQMGLESLSLGAKHVDFVDSNSVCTKIILKNITKTGIEPDQYDIFLSDVESYLKKCNRKYNIIITDPPYLQIDWSKLANLDQVSDNEAILILKYSPHNPPPKFSNWEIVKQKNAKDTIINIYLRS